MVDLGYETHNEMINLGSIFLFLFFIFLKLLLFGLLKCLGYFTQKVKPLVLYLGNGLFYNNILVLLIEAYFEVLISTYL